MSLSNVTCFHKSCAMSSTPSHSLMTSQAISITFQTSLGLTLKPVRGCPPPSSRLGSWWPGVKMGDISCSFLSTPSGIHSCSVWGWADGQRALELTRLRPRSLLATDSQCSPWGSTHMPVEGALGGPWVPVRFTCCGFLPLPQPPFLVPLSSHYDWPSQWVLAGFRLCYFPLCPSDPMRTGHPWPSTWRRGGTGCDTPSPVSLHFLSPCWVG